MTTTAHLLLIIIFSAPLVAAQNAPTRDTPSQPSYGLTGFNPSMAIIIVVLISAFFFMGFFSIYVRRCGGGRDSGDTLGGARNGSARGRSRRGANRGLDQAVINTFPTFAYSEVKNLKLGKGTLECAVCLCEFEDEETLRLLPKCSHVFHPDCIDMWLSTHVTCPVCRSNLSAVAAADPETTGDEPAPDLEAGPESDHDREQESIAPVGDENDRRDRQVDVSAPPVINQAPIRPPRSGSSRRPKIAGRFPRSHSTGHSLVQPGENCERYTLRLPKHVRKQILQRTGSCVACPADASEGSTRRGRMFGRSESGAAKSDRWVFPMVPSFISRSFSVKSVSVKRAGSGDVEQGTKTVFPSVNSCLGGAKGEDEESVSTRPQKSATPVFTVSTSPR